MLHDSVSVITVNFNGEAHLGPLLRSLREQTVPPCEVIVVDNGSTDESERIVLAEGARWLPLGTNEGLAPGFRRGAEVAKGSFFLFVNNDMRFEPEFVGALLNAKAENPAALAIDAVQLDATGSEVVHSVVQLKKDRWHLTGDVPGYRVVPAAGVPARAHATLFASGANFFVSRQDYERLGGWDVGFFLGHEDIDIGWRAWLAGGPIILEPSAVCLHDVSATSRVGRGIAARNYGALTGRLRFAAKHLPPERAAVVVLVSIVGLLFSVVRGGFGSRLRAWRDFGRSFPSLVFARRALYSAAGVTPRQHLRSLGSEPSITYAPCSNTIGDT